MVERLDFLFCPEDAPCPPRVDHSRYERVVWCGVSFRRFTRLWTPERSHFFSPSFQERALAGGQRLEDLFLQGDPHVLDELLSIHHLRRVHRLRVVEQRMMIR